MKAKITRAESLLSQPNPNPGEALVMLTPLAATKNPPWPVLHYIGVAYMYKNEFETALRWLQKSIQAGSNEATTYHSISVCHYNLGKFNKAINFEKKALEIENFYKGWMHLGAIYRAQAKLEKALTCYKKAAELEPDNTSIAYQIAEIYRDNGRLDKALELFEYTTNKGDDSHAGYLAMAKVLVTQNQFDKAKEYLDKILASKPKSVAAQTILSYLYRTKGDYKKAIEICEKLLNENPKAVKLRLNYAICQQELGEFDKAERNYLQALEDEPDEYQSLSNYLMCLHYNPKQSKEDIFEAHKLWDQHFAPDEKPERPQPSNKNRDKKLRIGFISGGFQNHPVGWMITPGLEHLPRDQFEIYCYTTTNRYDGITKRISQTADTWRSVIGYNDEIIARMIREDEIDILVELSGHAADNRLRMIALEPAPVIVKWVGGLFNTTGLQSVDYLITDRYETPKGEEEFYTEKLVRMPDDYVCYLPPIHNLDVGPSPVKENGFITFGCFNNPSKVNNAILEQWAKIMNHVPDSRLILKSKQYDTEALRDQIITTMEESGITEDRIKFKGHTGHSDHLSWYNQVDIALDPWPYSGGVTTCESLWMGVPVITKPGPTFAGRHSATHLTNAGFPEWVVDTWNEYVETAIALANAPAHLSELRETMRDQFEQSPLCDGQRFGAHLSIAFKEMWKQRIDGYENNTEEWQDHIDIKALSEKEIRKIVPTPRTAVKTTGDENKSHPEKETNELLETKSNGHSKVNGVQKNGTKSSQQKEPRGTKTEETAGIFRIETKDDVTVCTPANLNLLTPYVLLEQEEWLEPETTFIRGFVSRGMNIVDVGAGFGVYSLPIAKTIGDKGNIYAFEPGSLARKFLEKSKIQNDLAQLQIIGKAVADQSGKGRLTISEMPELNKLDKEGSEEIPKITLDEWWDNENQPDIDFLKIDVNGDEQKVLNGAETLLSESSPVVMFAIGEAGRKNTQEIEKKLEDKGYALYEFVPRLQLLTEHDSQQEIDPYLMNLIAIKDSSIEKFRNEKWIFDESVNPGEPEKDLWKTMLKNLPWTESVFSQWGEHTAGSEYEDYLKALDSLCAAEQVYNRSAKGTLTLQAVQMLVQIYNRGNMSAPVAMTLARGLNMLGKRDQAAEILSNLAELTNLNKQNLNVDLPFLPPLPDQDQIDVKTDFSGWLMVRILEAVVLLKDVSTFLSGQQELEFLVALEGNPETQSSIDKRFAVAAIREEIKLDDAQKNRIRESIKDDRNQRLLSELLGTPTPSKVISNDFWNAAISPQKGKAAVDIAEKLKQGKLDGHVDDLIKECQHRIDTKTDTDSIAFFILVNALLSLDTSPADYQPKEILDEKLKAAGWNYKKTLYSYFFDSVEELKKSESPTLSIVVVSHRLNDDVLENLKEIDRQKDENTEVIFVNNGLEDDALIEVKKYVNQLIHLSQNAGACMARNFGAVFAESDLVVFVDDDGIPAGGMFKSHRKIHESHDAIVARGVYEPKTENGEKPEHYNLGPRVKPAVCYLEGNTSFKTRPFYDVGGWNDAILVYHEGLELSYRYFKEGYNREKLIYFPDAVLKHDFTKSPDSQDRKKRLMDSSYVLIQAMYDDLGNVIASWPDSFISRKSNSIPKNSEYKALSRVCYLAPGQTDSAYGLHNKQAEILAKKTREEGVRADILHLTDPEFLSKIVDISKEPGHAVHSGVMGYPSWLTIDRVQSVNLFDHLNTNIFAMLGDHLFASFMWHRMEKTGDNTVFYTQEKNLIDELEYFGPKSNPHFIIDFIAPLSDIDNEKASKKHESREIDILIPWALKPGFTDIATVHNELSKMGNQAASVGKVLMEDLKSVYDQSILPRFRQCYSSVVGGKYEFSEKKTTEDYRWMNMLHLVDQHIRQYRRFNLLQQLTDVSDRFNIVITADKEKAAEHPDLHSLANIQWIGNVSTKELDHLYANSKIVLNCNPTFPNNKHVRILNAMSWGCSVITDKIPALSKAFEDGKHLLFVDESQTLNNLIGSGSVDHQKIADNGRKIATEKYTQERFCKMLLEKMNQHIAMKQ